MPTLIDRKIIAKFKNWYKHEKTQALFVTGARQVGKTFAILEFLNNNANDFVHFDLVEQLQIRDLFESAKNAQELFERITFVANKKLTPNKTVIFIDEVQESPNTLTLIKYLLNSTDFSYILSGSLLGVELNNVRSIPVGSLHIVEMYPLDFEEFALACGVQPQHFELVKNTALSEQKIPDYMHESFLDLFHKYLLVGGMPAAVASYLETHDLRSVRSIQQHIVNLYKRDISKYVEKKDRLIISNIYDNIPANLATQSKRFNLAKLKKGAKYNNHLGEFLWLIDAGVCIPTYNVSEPVFPLTLNTNSSYFKLFMNDVGMLTSQCDIKSVRSTNLSDFSINYGSIYENAVAQELLCHNYKPYYFRNNKLGELDFVIERNEKVIPLEIKSGKNYKRHSAINNALNKTNYRIEKGYVFVEDNVEARDKVTYLPIYAIDFFRKEK